MALFLLRRIAFILAVSAGIVFFCFFGLAMASNSTQRVPSYDPRPPARLAYRATIDYVRGLAQGDLGTLSERVGRQVRQTPVTTRLAERYPRSLGLLASALGVAALAGIPLGVAAATLRSPILSTGTMTLTLLGTSLPSFFLAALLQLGEITWYRTFGFRLVPVGGFGWDARLVLPTLVLAARPLAHLARVAYVSFREIQGEDYVRTARAKGLLRRLVLWVHIGRNAAVPLLTALGVSVRFSLASLPVVEFFFGWPGLGIGLLDAVRDGQPQAVAGMALALGLTLMLVNLLLDLLYRYADPRLRERTA